MLVARRTARPGAGRRCVSRALEPPSRQGVRSPTRDCQGRPRCLGCAHGTSRRARRSSRATRAADVQPQPGLGRTAVDMTTVCEGIRAMSAMSSVSVSEVGRFEVRTWPDRERVILAVAGELDLASVGALRAALNEVLAAGWENIVLDLRELTFIDSTGLSLLLKAERAARHADARFAIVDGSPAVARLLELVGLSDHFSRARVP